MKKIIIFFKATYKIIDIIITLLIYLLITIYKTENGYAVISDIHSYIDSPTKVKIKIDDKA